MNIEQMGTPRSDGGRKKEMLRFARTAGIAAAVTMLLLLLAGNYSPSADDRCSPRDRPLQVYGSKDATGMRSTVIGDWPGYEGTRAVFQPLPEETDQEHGEEVAMARSGCTADVYILDLPWIPEFAEAGYIDEVGIPEKDLRHIIKKVLDSGRYDGRLWAVPLNTDAPLLYYRKDLVSAPTATWATNWAALKAQARIEAARLPADPDDPADPADQDHSGYTLQLGQYEGFVVNILELIRAHNGDITVSKGGKVSLPRGAVIAALRDLADAMHGTAPAISPNALGTNESGSREAFKKGRVAFMRNWPSSYALIVSSNALKPEQIGVEPFPGSGSLGGQSMVIASRLPGKRVAAARALIKYLTGEALQKSLFACGGFAPVRQDVYVSELNDVQCPGMSGRPQDVVRHAPPDKILQAVLRARPRPSLAFYSEFSHVLQTQLHARLECKVSSQPCQDDKGFLDDLTKALEDAARGHGSG